MDVAKKMLGIAKVAHKGQKRKFTGEDYIVHPISVGKVFKGICPIREAVGYGHDTIEDTNVTVLSLLDENINHKVVEAIYILTKKEKESYFDFNLRIIRSKNDVAIEVKQEDIKHNLQDLKEGAMKDKYRLALYLLEKASDDNYKIIDW